MYYISTYLQLSLNCLMMLDTFSNLCTSLCGRRWQWEMTRNVARSNNNTSSASMMLANWSRLCSNSFTFGISLYTIEDHACQHYIVNKIYCSCRLDIRSSWIWDRLEESNFWGESWSTVKFKEIQRHKNRGKYQLNYKNNG